MVEYSKVNVKLSDNQLKKLKTAVKNKTGTTLRIVRAGSGRPSFSASQNKKGKGIVRAGTDLLFSSVLQKNGVFNTASSFNKF